VFRWSVEKKLHLNIAKCEVTFFSPDTAEVGPDALRPIRVNGLPLRFNSNPVFLGVTYDRTLSFGPQAKKVAARITTTSRLQKALSGTEWGWDARSQGRVYQSLGLSTARYCGAGWQPWLKPSNVEVIERAQSKCLRAATGMYATSPVESLRRETGFSSIATVIRRDAAVAMEKSLRLGPLNPRRLMATRQVEHRTDRGSWRQLATREVRAVGLDDEPRDPLPPASEATWKLGASPRPIKLDLLGGTQRLLDLDALRVSALATICSYGPLDFTIFTDGSVEGGMENGGCAAVVCRGTMSTLQLVDVVGRRGARFSSSFDAEVSAIRVAVEWLIRHGGPSRSLICSDSRAVLEALRPGYRGTSGSLAVLRDRLQQVPGALFLQWVPAHCGLVGNEIADGAAKAARSAPGPREPVTYASAKARIRRGIGDGPPAHHRTREIYGDRRPPFPGQSRDVPRKMSTTLARLRSGHALCLAEYRHRVGKADSPLCPKCKEAPENLVHWLQQCPATLALRHSCFGDGGPPLSVLTMGGPAVASYLRGLRLF
jgi:ribonuclease HI